VGVTVGVVDAPKEKALSLVGVLSSSADPKATGLVGLGDGEPNKNGLDCGVVLTLWTGVVVEKENPGFTGDGVEGVVEAGRDVDGGGVDATTAD